MRGFTLYTARESFESVYRRERNHRVGVGSCCRWTMTGVHRAHTTLLLRVQPAAAAAAVLPRSAAHPLSLYTLSLGLCTLHIAERALMHSPHAHREPPRTCRVAYIYRRKRKEEIRRRGSMASREDFCLVGYNIILMMICYSQHNIVMCSSESMDFYFNSFLFYFIWKVRNSVENF